MRTRVRPLAGLLLACVCAAAADEPQVNVSAGFDRKTKGDYAPVRVEIATSDEPFDGEIRIPYRMFQSQDLLVRRAQVPAHARFALRLCMPIESAGRQIELQVAESNGRTTAAPLDFKSVFSPRLVLAIGEAAGGLESDAGKPADAPKDAAAAPETLDVSYLEPRLAPVHWQAYLGLDLVILHAPEPTRFEPAQVRALIRWVELGGRLAISLGTQPVTIAGTWLEDLLPCAANGIAELDALEDLDRKFGAEKKTTGRFGVARLKPIADAVVAAEQAGTVLACTLRRQGGFVTALAFDYQAPPFRGRPSVKKLLEEIGPAATGNAWDACNLALSQSVPRRMSAAHALDWRKAAWLAGLLLVYLFFFKYLQRRLLSPPVTQRRVLVLLPAVPLGTALLVALILFCLPIGPTQVNTVAVVFLRPDAAVGEAHVYRTLHSPRAQTARLLFDEPDLIVEQECGANVELLFGGGYRFRQEDSAALENVTLLPSVPRTFLTTSWRTLAGPLVVRLDRSTDPWTATVENRTGLEIHDLCVARVGGETPLGDLAAGGTFRGPLPEFSPILPPAGTSPWSAGQRSLRETVRADVYGALELTHPPQGAEAGKPAVVTGWVRLDPDMKLAVDGPQETEDDSLLLLSVPVGEEPK